MIISYTVSFHTQCLPTRFTGRAPIDLAARHWLYICDGVGGSSQQYAAISRAVASPWPSMSAYNTRLCNRLQQRLGAAKYTN